VAQLELQGLPRGAACSLTSRVAAGDGRPSFGAHAGGAVPRIAEFEGGEFFNLGASHADSNRDLVTAALGFRSRLNESVDLGLAYEIPLTNDEESLMKERVTLDLIWKF
jgi:hypothetical protein